MNLIKLFGTGAGDVDIKERDGDGGVCEGKCGVGQEIKWKEMVNEMKTFSGSFVMKVKLGLRTHPKDNWFTARGYRRKDKAWLESQVHSGRRRRGLLGCKPIMLPILRIEP